MSAARRRGSGIAAVAAMAVSWSTAHGAEDIRDIRAPPPAAPAWVWPALVAAGLAAAAATFLGWRAWRRRRERALTPLARALAELSAARALMQPASADQFSVTVSGIVRRYIEQRFAVRATQRTSEEFLREILAAPEHALASHRAQLAEFLQQCDLAKFSGQPLTPQNLEAIHTSAGDFVRATAGEPHAALSAA
jgi:hypothetical protein